jgi:phage terminase large subunit-like protein
LKDLQDGHERGLSFDLDAANRAFSFFEEVLRLSEGQFDGQPFILHESQAFIVGSLFGWKRANGTRRFRRAYVEQGKGNGKSPLAGGIGLYGMVADGEAGAQIYAAAAKREQAGILFSDAVKMVRQSPALAKRVEFSGGVGREYNMAHHKSGSFFRPVSRDTGKSGSGPRPYFVLADEVHELPDGKILEMLERGFKFRRQPLLFMITNSGSDRNSVAWHEHEWAVKVAAGHEDAVTDPTFVGRPLDDDLFSYVCALDGPRTERLEYNHSFDHIEGACTCRSVSTTRIERLTAEVFADSATCGGTDWRARLDALITQTDPSSSPASATSATTSKKSAPRRDGQKSDSIKSGGSQKTENESQNTSANGSQSDQVTDNSRPLNKSSENSGSRVTSALSLLRRAGNALSAARRQKDSASTTVTRQGSTEGSCASSAILQSVYSETLRRVWLAHSDTCESRKAKLDGSALQVDIPADDPLNDPSCWQKANPLLGVTITEEYLAGVVAQAKNLPTKQNNILRLHFCMWTDSDVAWMSREVIEPLLADFDPKQHKGKRVGAGLDLSQNRDITAAAFVVETGAVEVECIDRNGATVTLKKPTFDAWIEAWTPGDTMRARSERDKIPYEVWARQGFIHAPPGENISFRHVAQTLVEYDQDYDIAIVGYDRYAFKRFEEDAADLKLSLPFVEHPQGGTKKGKPTKEMEAAAKRAGKEPEGLWFPSSLRALEEAFIEKRIRLRRNPVLISALMSAVTEQDKWENRWLTKAKSVNKIDAAVALVIAFGSMQSMPAKREPIKMFMVG